MKRQLLNLFLKLQVFEGPKPTLDPKRRSPDWDRQWEGIPTGQSFDREVLIPPATVQMIATTARMVFQDTTTEYTITQPNPAVNSFRWAWVGGTNPLLRTARAIAVDASTQITVTRSGNVVRYTATGGTLPTLTSVLVGDSINIEPTTVGGDTSPFNVLNQGVFTIVTVNSGSHYVEVLNTNGVPEGPIVLGTRVIDGFPPLTMFSAAGVQVADTAHVIDPAFNIENRTDLQITNVTALYFDVLNALGIPEGPITLTSASGIVFYPSLWNWLYAETDQLVSMRVNADTSDNSLIEPVPTGPPEEDDRPSVGVYLKHGGVYSVTVANNGLYTAKVKVTLAE